MRLYTELVYQKIIIYDISTERTYMFEIDYYTDSSGCRPVEKFIDSLGVKMKAKLFGRLELLEEHGSQLGMPYSRYLEDGIFELRIVQGSDIIRVMYFIAVGDRVILTHGFVKKTQRTPRSEIGRAKSLREDWGKRNE